MLPAGQKGWREGRRPSAKKDRVTLSCVKASFNVLGYTGFKAFRRGVPQGKDKGRKGNPSSLAGRDKGPLVETTGVCTGRSLPHLSQDFLPPQLPESAGDDAGRTILQLSRDNG